MKKEILLLGAAFFFSALMVSSQAVRASGADFSRENSGSRLPARKNEPVIALQANASEAEKGNSVRICDTYGSGYFFIPGTEICLNVGGYVFLDLKAVSMPDSAKNGNFNAKTKASLQANLASETELGTLKTFVGVDFLYNLASNKDKQSIVELSGAWTSLLGFTLGLQDSAFSSFPSYAGTVIQNDIIPFGSLKTPSVTYIYDAQNALSFIAAIEGAYYDNQKMESLPNLAAGIKYTSGWGVITGISGLDTQYAGLASKLRLDFKLNENLSLFAMAGYGNEVSRKVEDNKILYTNFYKAWNGTWAFWAGGSLTVSDKLAVNFQGSFSEGNLVQQTRKPNYGLVANVDYQLVKDFHIFPEVSYFNDPSTDKSSIGGLIRFKRNF